MWIPRDTVISEIKNVPIDSSSPERERERGRESFGFG